MKRSPIARTKPPRRVNRQRKASEFTRAYGSKERVAFVRSLPCIGCGKVGHSENAHVGNGGAGRKADASSIVPLCAYRSPNGSYGCHRRLHNIGRKTFEQRNSLDLDAEAAKVEAAWQEKQSA